MKFRLRKVAAIFATLLMCAPRVQANDPQPAETVNQTFSDWFVTCPKENACRMSQVIVQPTTGRLILQLQVHKSPVPGALLTFPLGILLSTGWRYQIDGGKPKVTPFEICNTEGCHVGLNLDASLLKSLKRGNKMTITFFDAATTEVSVDVSLKGFTKAYGALQ
jgi:invasion protein IalB